MAQPYLRNLLKSALLAALIYAGASRADSSLIVQQNHPTPASGATDRAPLVIRLASNPAPVPDFTVRDLNGKPISPAAWRGHVVLLNFWATWCGPCRYEIPELIDLQKRYPQQLLVIGLSVDEGSPELVRKFAERLGVNYPVAMASEELQQKFGGILSLPTSFLIDRQGRLVQKHVGLYPEEIYDAEVRALLGLPVNARVETFVDQGQVFPANVKNAQQLPGIDMSALTPAQKKVALRQMNQQHCTCGCGYTIALCRIQDTACPVSQKLGQEIVNRLRAGTRSPSAKH